MDVVRKGANYNILAPTPPELLVPGADPRLFSLAHVMPIGGPVRNNKFKLDGKEKLLTPNLPDLPLFTNGTAWQQPWTGKKDGKSSATCRYKHKANAFWPFDFSVIAVFDLEEDQLIITYEINNDSRSGIMPYGYGATMRLPKMRNTLISAGVSSIWHNDANGVPDSQHEIPFNLDLKEGLKLDGIDTPERYYSGWIGKTSIDYAESRLSLTLKADSDFGFLGFACGKDDSFFRLTSLTHVPGMLDMKGYDEDDTGYKVLGAGESISSVLKVDVDLS